MSIQNYPVAASTPTKRPVASMLAILMTSLAGCGGGVDMPNTISDASAMLVREATSPSRASLTAVSTAASSAANMPAIAETSAAMSSANSSSAKSFSAVTEVLGFVPAKANGTAFASYANFPAVSIKVAGQSVTPVDVDVIRTRSGDWLLQNLGAYQDVQVYLMKVSTNPKFLRAFACRRAFNKESGDSTALSMRQVSVSLSTASANYDWTLGLAQGACRVMQNGEPVGPNPQWLREAVASNRLPAYKRENAWDPSALKAYAPDGRRGAYDPTSLGPVLENPAATPTASNNYVGTTSGQGGEYVSSRGFLHTVDAGVVDLALHNEDSAISTVWSQFVQYTWYSLAQPQGAVWSNRLHTTVDPQVPQSGEMGWEIAGAGQTNPQIMSLTTVDNWTRDVAHLENTGFIHWILTEDPVAGLVVQRQAAFALAGYYEYQRQSPGVYGASNEQDRGIYNTLSAMWKSRDVSRAVSSLNSSMIWPIARVDKQVADTLNFYDFAVYQPMLTAVPGASNDYARKLAGAGLSLAPVEPMNTPSGSVEMLVISNFFIQQYGKEPLYLWAKFGHPQAVKWLRTAATHMAARVDIIGGKAGIDGCVGVRGSSIPLKVNGAVPIFNDTAGWATWVKQQCPQVVSNSFDGAYVHTTIQTEGFLRLAKAAGVTGLDVTLQNFAATKARTTSIYDPGLQMHKHLAGPVN